MLFLFCDVVVWRMLGLLSGAFPCLKGDFLCCWGVYFVNFVYFCSGIYNNVYEEIRFRLAGDVCGVFG